MCKENTAYDEQRKVVDDRDVESAFIFELLRLDAEVLIKKARH